MIDRFGCLGTAIIVAIAGGVIWLLFHFGLFTLLALIALITLFHIGLMKNSKKWRFWAIDALVALVILSGYSGFTRDYYSNEANAALNNGNYSQAYEYAERLKNVRIDNLPSVLTDSRYESLNRNIMTYFNENILGVWSGEYTDSGGTRRRMDLDIIDYDSKNKSFNSVMCFYPHENEYQELLNNQFSWMWDENLSKSGTIYSSVYLDIENMSITIDEERWMHHPEGYTAISFNGNIDFDNKTISSSTNNLDLHKVSGTTNMEYEPICLGVLLKDISCSAKSDTGGFNTFNYVHDNAGNTYSNGLGGVEGDNLNWQEYQVNKEYSEFRGRIALNYDYKTMTSGNVWVSVYGDGQWLYSSPAITAGMIPVDFVIDISNVSVLRVCIDGTNMARLVDAALYKDRNANTYSSCVGYGIWANPKPLSEIYWMYASTEYGGFHVFETGTDAYGVSYSNVLGGATGNTNFQDYYLGGKYTSIEGTVFLNEGCGGTNYTGTYLRIYKDGVLAYTSPLVRSGMPSTNFSVDLTGVQKIRVEMVGQNVVRLGNCVLKK